jgi:hypothetical protein
MELPREWVSLRCGETMKLRVIGSGGSSGLLETDLFRSFLSSSRENRKRQLRRRLSMFITFVTDIRDIWTIFWAASKIWPGLIEFRFHDNYRDAPFELASGPCMRILMFDREDVRDVEMEGILERRQANVVLDDTTD